MGGSSDSLESRLYNSSYLVLELRGSAAKTFRENLSVLEDLVPDVIYLIQNTLIAKRGGSALFVFKYTGEPVHLEGDGVEIYTADKIPGDIIVYQEAEPRLLSEQSLNRLVSALSQLNLKVSPRQEKNNDNDDPPLAQELLQQLTVEVKTSPGFREELWEDTDLVEELREWGQERRKSRAKLIKILFNYFAENYYIITNDLWDIYCFDEEDKIYVKCDKRIKNKIVEAGKMADIEEYITRYVLNEVIEKLRAFTYTPWKELERSKWFIATRNGYIINIKKWVEEGRIEVYEPSPELFITTKINASLNIEKLKWALEQVRNGRDWLELGPELCPRIHKAFTEWVEPENVRALYEIIGYTLYPEYVLHKAIMLVGEGANGKSTYLKLIKIFLGKDNVSNVSLQELTENRFSKAQLVGKLANIYPDIPDKPLRYTGIFKALTGQDTIFIDVKHRQGFSYENYAKLIFSANQLPPVNDMTFAFWRRWIIIKFPNKFKANPGFIRELLRQEELDGLLIMSLLALRDLMLRKEFSVKGDFKEHWLRSTNSVYAFIQDLLAGKVEYEGKTVQAKRSKSGYIETKMLYSIYVNYCQENDLDPVSKRDFTIEMERLGFRKVKIHRTTYYKGLELVNNWLLEES